MTERPESRTPVRLGLFALAVVGALAGLWALVHHLSTDPLADVRAYYDAGARLNAGLPLYVQPAGPDEAAFYRYPPLLAIAFRPLALLPYEVAALIWEGLMLAAFAATIWLIGVRRPATWLLLGILALPTAWTLAIGQAQALVTLLLTVASPWAVALAGSLKVFPALAAVFWLGRRDWPSLGLFAAWLGGLVLLQLVLAPQATLDYIGFLTLEQVGAGNNLSPFAVAPWLWVALVAVLVVVAVRTASGPWGWAAAVTLSVLATPRLFAYQLSTLLAAISRRAYRPRTTQPDAASAEPETAAAGPERAA